MITIAAAAAAAAAATPLVVLVVITVKVVEVVTVAVVARLCLSIIFFSLLLITWHSSSIVIRLSEMLSLEVLIKQP